MADVSVEFGATDTGLQKTLETIQQQMSSLQSEVDSGTLSFQEINQKMRELRQAEGIFTKLGGEVSEATKSAKEFENQIRLAEAVTKSNRTALEIYSEEVDKLGKLLDSGLISQKTYAAAIEKAEAALKSATPQTEEAKRANEELEASLKLAEAETKALAEEQKKAEAITKSNRSATEIYNQEIEELQKHLSGGRISMETFEKAVAKADAKLAAANPQVEELGKDIADTGNKSDKMGDQAGIGFGKLAAAVGVGQLAAKAFTAALDAGFAAVRNTIQGFTDALDLGGTLSDLSAATGESAGNLLLLQRAFDNTGAGADKVAPALAKLQNNIFGAGEGSKEAAAAFGRMGLSMEELAGKTPTEQLALVASGITSIEDPAARAATAIDIFGKSGAELLPLLTNFSGEMAEASATVGSLADIMNRRAAIFDAVGDRFLVIQQKVRDFAAGIIDRALPAIDAITTALSRIDAAAIGQRLADAFLGGQDAMKGFQSAVDAISIGKVALAFELFWESLKLQAMQSGNAIYKNLSAGLQTAADAIVDLFGPSSGTFTLLIDSFAYAGKASGVKFAEGILALLPDVNEGILKTLNLAALVMPGLAAPVAAAFQGANTALDTIRGSLGGMQADLEKQKETLGASFTNFSANAKKQLGEIPKEFEANLASANAEFFKTGEQAAVVKTLQDKVTEATAATTAEREKQTAQTQAELAARQALKDQQAAADAQAKADKTALIELETQINAAKAAGNTELAASLEKQLQQKKAAEEIAKLTEEYVKTLGVDADEAARLATNFVNAKNAANSIADRNVSVSVTTKVDDTRWKQLLADIAANADPKAVKVALEVTGKEKLSDAYSTLQNMEQINKNYTAAFSAIGAKSIEEVKQNLDGIPTEAQRQLALRITGEDDFDRAVQKLDSFAGTKEARLLLQAQGFDTMDAFQKQLEGITGEKRTDLILNALGVDTVDAAVDALDAILKANGKSATVQVGADTTAATQKLDSLGAAAVTVPIDADTASASAKLDALAKPIVLSLDTSGVAAAISDIQTQIQNSFFGGAGGTGGTGGTGGQGGAGGNATANMGTLQKLVEAIKDAVEKIEPKLPQTALV